MENPYQPPAARLGSAIVDGVLADGTYEFTERENAVIGRTARLARAWGILSLVAGVLLLIFGLVAVGVTLAFADQIGDSRLELLMVLAVAAALLPVAIVNLATGWYYIGAGKAFSDVVETSGNDLASLMSGLASTTKAFQVEVIFTSLALTLGLGVQITAIVLDATRGLGD